MLGSVYGDSPSPICFLGDVHPWSLDLDVLWNTGLYVSDVSEERTQQRMMPRATLSNRFCAQQRPRFDLVQPMIVVVVALVALLALLTTVRSQCQSSNSLSWSHPPKFIDGIHGTVIYNGLNTPRGLRYDGAGHLLVVETSKGIVGLFENSDGCLGWTKRVVVEDASLNHGIAINGTALYASAPEYVYSWTYDPQALTAFNKQTIVNIPSGASSVSHKYIDRHSATFNTKSRHRS